MNKDDIDRGTRRFYLLTQVLYYETVPNIGVEHLTQQFSCLEFYSFMLVTIVETLSDKGFSSAKYVQWLIMLMMDLSNTA